MKNINFVITNIKAFYRLFRIRINNQILLKRQREKIFSLIILISLWVQVPQWKDDWSRCAVDIPDSSCHWYIKSPDNTYGEGFDWENAPWFDVNGLNDISRTEKETVLERLQKE